MDKKRMKTGRILVFEYTITNKLRTPFENGDNHIQEFLTNNSFISNKIFQFFFTNYY
jgi:hypothetical protein